MSKDEEREAREREEFRRRKMENQEAVLRQIEEKRANGKGMTADEFEFNKELLKEIASKKKEMRMTINSQQMANASTG